MAGLYALAAAFFAADQHRLLEHVIADVVKANGRFFHAQVVQLRQLVHNLRGRDRFDDQPALALIEQMLQ